MSRQGSPDLVRFLARDEVERRQQAAAEGRARAELVVTEGDGPPVLRLYDVIDDWGGWWGISASEVAAALDDLSDQPEVHVHVNSPGGVATEGIAIANLLRQFPGTVVAIVDGLAASAASMVLTGASQVVMGPSSQMMIHEASGGVWGPADFVRKEADALDHLSDRYAEAYARKAGGEPDDWRAVMKAETWFSPDEAVEAGLADKVLEQDATDDPEGAVARFDLRRFAHAGRDDAPAPQLPRAAALGRPAAAGGTTREEPDTMSDTLIAGLRERLGIADDADEPTILSALDEALTEVAEPPTATAPPAGTVLVDEQVFATLQTQAADGAAARAQQETERRERLVNEAVADGRIAPAQRAAWLDKLTAEGEAGETVLASLQKGLIPLAAVGMNAGADISEDDSVYASLFPSEKKVS